MAHFSPVNSTSSPQGFETEVERAMPASPSNFNSNLEILNSETEDLGSDEDMDFSDDCVESEDEDSETSMVEDDDSEDSENDQEPPSADVEMSVSEVEKASETGDSTSRGNFRRNGSISLQVSKLSFKDLQNQRQQIIAGSTKYESTYTLTDSTAYDAGKAGNDLRSIITTLRKKILELEKRKENIEAEIEVSEKDIENTQQKIIEQQIKILLEHNGISQELMDEFERFRSTIEPSHGQKSGFSILVLGTIVVRM